MSARFWSSGAPVAVLSVAVLITATGCTAAASRHSVPPSAGQTAAGSVGSSASRPTRPAPRPKPAETGSEAGGTSSRGRFHGDGLTSKFRNACSNMPFPGPITTAFQMHECWAGTWHGNYLMYMLGYKPGTKHRHQQMIVGLANGQTRVVNLRSTDGIATLAHFGRTCGVVAYPRTKRKTYYMPFRRRIVRHCRWRH